MGHLVNDMNAYVMGFFLPLSIVNVWENSTTFFARRRKLDALQWLSSVSQLINLILHFILNTGQNLRCALMASLETQVILPSAANLVSYSTPSVFYEILQVGSAYVIIYRATAIVPDRRHRILVRCGLAVLQGVSLGLNLASTILMKMEIIDRTCVPIYNVEYNDSSQIVLAVLYFILLIAFCVPIVQNIRKSEKCINKSTLKTVATVTAAKLILVILFQVVTVVLSLKGYFGEYFWIQFTLQNFSIVWASTIASRKPLKENNTGITVTSASRRTQNSSGISSNRFEHTESESSGINQIENQIV